MTRVCPLCAMLAMCRLQAAMQMTSKGCLQDTDLVLFCELESKVFACAVFSDVVDDQVSCVKGEFCCAILIGGDMHLRAHFGPALKMHSNISSK